MGDSAELVGRRGVLKGQMTRILSYTQGERRDIDVNQIKSRKDRLKELFDSFEEVQSSIEEESGVSEESENYRVETEVYYKAMANCEKIIKEEKPEQSTSHFRTNNETRNNSSTSSNQVPSVKLTALQIPKFTGLYSE